MGMIEIAVGFLVGFCGGWYVRRRYALQVEAKLEQAQAALKKAGVDITL